MSNFSVVNAKALKLYGRPVYISNRKNKKYMILNNSGKFVHFGDSRYEDFTAHNDTDRRAKYLARATQIRGPWRNDIFSPNFLSITLLW
jgi:acid phosphatase class B